MSSLLSHNGRSGSGANCPRQHPASGAHRGQRGAAPAVLEMDQRHGEILAELVAHHLAMAALHGRTDTQEQHGGAPLQEGAHLCQPGGIVPELNRAALIVRIVERLAPYIALAKVRREGGLAKCRAPV